MLGCDDADGRIIEVVAKLRGREMNMKMQIAELITALFAPDVGIVSATPVLVEIPAEFHTIIGDRSISQTVTASSGLNFGTVNLGEFTTWVVGQAPSGVQRDQAAAIFAFDVLIQNADRRASNPNVWARAGQLGVFDHDQAFTFLALPIIGGAPKPWIPADQVQGFAFLKEHVFYSGLKGKIFDLEPFEMALAALTDTQLESYLQAVPPEWRQEKGYSKQIVEYLAESRSEAKRLVSFAKHVLR